jgi:hypothetical protein
MEVSRALVETSARLSLLGEQYSLPGEQCSLPRGGYSLPREGFSAPRDVDFVRGAALTQGGDFLQQLGDVYLQPVTDFAEPAYALDDIAARVVREGAVLPVVGERWRVPPAKYSQEYLRCPELPR